MSARGSSIAGPGGGGGGGPHGEGGGENAAARGEGGRGGSAPPPGPVRPGPPPGDRGWFGGPAGCGSSRLGRSPRASRRGRDATHGAREEGRRRGGPEPSTSRATRG